ncbi:MAG: hypothetical protein GY711_10335 [bacterium]|nr:hypothetical protein [bacterium]
MHPLLPLLSRARAGLLLACATLLASATAHAQMMQLFGDWVAPGSAQLFVSTNGAIGNPGTLAQPLPSITSALQAAVVAGNLGTVPVTINVLPGGTFGVAQGEVFPITLPAHGVSIEAYGVGAGPLPLVNATGSPTVEVFLFNTIGTPGLPDSVLRGLEVTNIGGIIDTALVRIDVPLGAAPAPQRVAPEIRDCLLLGGTDFGIDVVGAPAANAGITLEPVIERNIIEFERGKATAPTAGVHVTGGASPTSPLIRANQIQRYPVNVLLEGGGLSHQARVQANFIQLGATNVRCEDCAPFLVGNTIAFAYAPGLVPIGVDWTVLVTELTLANNLIWNPDQIGLAGDPQDVAGPAAALTAGGRLSWFNYDQDDALRVMVPLPNFGPGLGPPNPDFVGGNVGNGAALTDLHLNPTSQLRELAPAVEAQPSSAAFPNLVLVPGFPGPSVVRRDHAFDGDFDARVSGGALPNDLIIDIGADEVTDLGPAGTRGATLARSVGSAVGVDLDILGNLVTDPAGQWLTEVDVAGTPGDLVILLSGVGFFDFITDPAFPGAMIENTSVYQNILGDATLFPPMLTQTSLAVDLTGGSVTVAVGIIPAGGVLTVPANFGPADPVWFEAEAFLQAIVLDPTGTLIQATNRLPVELNE